MLATIGFLTAALLLILFAGTFYALVKTKHKTLRPFAWAYLLVALACLMWAVLSLLSANDMTLGRSVLIGDDLLMVASVCAAWVVIPPKWQNYVIPAALILAVVLVYIRGTYYYPQPSLQSGVLFFNTQHPVAVALSAVLLAAWLPASMKVARTLTNTVALRRFYALYVSLYALTVISAALFIQAHRRRIIILSFAAFAACILLLLLSNLVARRGGKAVKHGAK